MSNQEIRARLNRRYRSIFDLKSRIALRLGDGFRIWRPLEVREQSRLFDGKNLPELGRRNEIIVVRKSRQAGIAELSASVNLNEERAWIFVPELEIWFYDTGSEAGSNFVHHQPLLGSLLLSEFADAEFYHTHPRVAADVEFHNHEVLFDRLRLTENQTRPLVALPSSQDLLALHSQFSQLTSMKRPLETLKGHVVSEFGVTSYAIRELNYRDTAGRPQRLLPAFGVTDPDHLGVLATPLSTTEKIDHLLRRATLRSLESVAFMNDVQGWTEATRPRLIFEFRPHESQVTPH